MLDPWVGKIPWRKISSVHCIWFITCLLVQFIPGTIFAEVRICKHTESITPLYAGGMHAHRPT